MGEYDTDWSAIRATAAGERAPFEALVSRYDAYLRRQVKRYGSHRLGFADLDDFVDETWCQVFRRAVEGTFDPSRPFRSWLVGLCRNVLKSRKLHPSPLPASGPEGIDPPDARPGPDRRAISREIIQALQSELASCSDDALLLYEIIYVEGRTKVDAAKELGCSEANVRQNLLPKLHRELAAALARRGIADVTIEDINP